MKAIRNELGLLKTIRAKFAVERKEIGERIAQAQRCIGHPHVHRGVGLRKLQDDFYEIRMGLKIAWSLKTLQKHWFLNISATTTK